MWLSSGTSGRIPSWKFAIVLWGARRVESVNRSRQRKRDAGATAQAMGLTSVLTPSEQMK